MGKDCTKPSQDGTEIVMAGVKDSLMSSCASPPVLGYSPHFIHCHNTSFAWVQVFNPWFFLPQVFRDTSEKTILGSHSILTLVLPWTQREATSMGKPWPMRNGVGCNLPSPWVQGLLLNHILHNSSEGPSGTEPPLVQWWPVSHFPCLTFTIPPLLFPEITFQNKLHASKSLS